MIPIKSVLLLSLVIALSGCSYTTSITPNISPTAIAASQKDHKASITFSPSLLSASAKAKLDNTFHEYSFKGGDALRAALTRATEVAYSNVTYTQSRSVNNSFDHQVAFNLNYFDISLSQSPGFFSTTFKATCTVSVSVEVYDGTGKLISRRSASGSGISENKTNSYDKAKDYFAESAEKAIQQLADNVANLLM